MENIGIFAANGAVYKTATGGTTRRGVVGSLLHALAWALRKAADAVSRWEGLYVEARPELVAKAIDVTTDIEVAVEDAVIDAASAAAKAGRAAALRAAWASVAASRILVAVALAALRLALEVPGMAERTGQAVSDYMRGAWAFREEILSEACAA